MLVLNATGPQPEAPLAEVSWEDHFAQLAFFVKSPVLLGRGVLPGMRAGRFGRIVHIDSEGGRSAAARAVRVRDVEERPNRAHAQLGPGTCSFRHHGEHRRTRVRHQAARGR